MDGIVSNYRVSGYERLSREDDRKDESSSIESQKMIIESFAKFNNFKIIQHYSDDGFTGSNFNRPGFEQLIEAIETGDINCVIVKDLSRLGRELYETGAYIEEYFLSKNVRFIAINDGYDSEIGDAMLGIRLSVNDLYLRDTSKKIRSSFDAKRKKGDYIGSYAKFGYMKNPENPKQLIRDPNVDFIVLQIFEWIASGVGTSMVAHRLTKQGVPIPSIYKKERRANLQTELNHGNGIWRPQTVKGIASDKMYLGHMVQGRWKKQSYNSKRLLKLPESQWIVVENTHEPIVTQELYDKVQEELSKNKRYAAKNEKKHLFQGLLTCKECGHNMSILKKKNKNSISYYAECNYYTKYSKYNVCCTHRINYQYLEDDLLHFLKEVGKSFYATYEDDKLVSQALKIQQQKMLQCVLEMQKVTSEKEKNQKIIANLYDDRINEIISTRQYVMMSKRYEDMFEQLDKKEVALKMKMESFNKIDKLNEMKKVRTLLKQFMKFENPTNELMFQLIDKIEVDKDKNIEVYFKCDMSKYINLVRKKGEIAK